MSQNAISQKIKELQRLIAIKQSSHESRSPKGQEEIRALESELSSLGGQVIGPNLCGGGSKTRCKSGRSF